MTTGTTAPARTTTPVAHTVRRLGAALLVMAGWFWGIAVAAITVANVVAWLVTGRVDVSIAVYARQGSLWFPFSLAIMLVAAYLRVHVAAGMTRRTFVRAAVLVEVTAGLAYAAILTAVILAERAVHSALGWDATITEIQLTDESSPFWLLFLDLAVPFVLGNLSGLLVGIVYQTRGGWWGTLTLPLTVGPVAVSQYVAGARLVDLPGVWTTTPGGDMALAVGIGAALGVVMLLVFATLTRRAQLASNA
ncbi:MAG: hypothetical protein IR158_06365 [Cellulomonas sp.]|jgi:hypothetical protein|uniref:hypothetical protein n=1 Tax=Cellulomonas sp. TaxID=40001 RepID=UPI0019F621F1|nr:hypothetical protein [Cellulomonas sp.]MBF0687378.1 hypothetical protein [Cellulomonas sp.]